MLGKGLELRLFISFLSPQILGNNTLVYFFIACNALGLIPRCVKDQHKITLIRINKNNSYLAIDNRTQQHRENKII